MACPCGIFNEGGGCSTRGYLNTPNNVNFKTGYKIAIFKQQIEFFLMTWLKYIIHFKMLNY